MSNVLVNGLTPEAFLQFQALAGDGTDNIKGAVGIGAKIALDLIRAHGTVDAVIAACKDGTVALTKKKLEAVLEFEAVKDITMQLVTLRNDLKVPMVTKLSLAMKETT